jgi:hypothetical protein
MFFHIFGHIDTHHGRIVIEQKSRQSLCQLGLAYAGWPQEHEGPYRPVWILQARPGAANRVTDRGDVRLGYLFLQHMVAFAGFGFGHARFQPGNNAVHKHAGPREVTLALDAFEFAPRLIEFFLDLVRALDLALFDCQMAVRSASFSSSSAKSASSFSSRSLDALSVSLRSASRSIFSRMIPRSSSSIASSLESTYVCSWDADSSIKWIALSGMNRSVI